MLPSYMTDVALWKDSLPALLFPLLISFLLSLPYRRSSKRKLVCLSVLSLSLLGMTIGFITGLSREPAIGSVLPSVLSFIGLVMIYIIGVKRNKNSIIVTLSVIGLSINLFFGVLWGSKIRDYSVLHSEGYERKVETVNIEHSINIQKMKHEYELKYIRKAHEKKFIDRSKTKK